MQKQKSLFNHIVDENNFYQDYQEKINDTFSDPKNQFMDCFFVQKKLLQYLMALATLYTIFTASERLPSENNLFLFAGAIVMLSTPFREARQQKEAIFKLFQKAHFEFFNKEIEKRKLISDKIKLIALGDKILDVSEGKFKSNVHKVFILSTTALVGSFLFKQVALAPALVAQALIFATCNIARNVQAEKELKLLKKTLPKQITIPVCEKVNE